MLPYCSRLICFQKITKYKTEKLFNVSRHSILFPELLFLRGYDKNSIYISLPPSYLILSLSENKSPVIDSALVQFVFVKTQFP